tara:strand:+ start:1318 stop:1581 length:264 start_codon:yes stop_codon:yes gene_type:complete
LGERATYGTTRALHHSLLSSLPLRRLGSLAIGTKEYAAASTAAGRAALVGEHGTIRGNVVDAVVVASEAPVAVASGRRAWSGLDSRE